MSPILVGLPPGNVRHMPWPITLPAQGCSGSIAVGRWHIINIELSRCMPAGTTST